MNNSIRNLFLVVSLIGATTVFAQKDGGQKIGFVNTFTIITQLPESKDIEVKLGQTVEAYKDTMATLQKEAQDRFEKYQKQKGTMSAESQKKEEEDLLNLQQRLQQYQQTAQQSLEKRRIELLEPIRKKIMTAIDAIAKKEKFTYILEKNEQSIILYSDDKFDLTFKVLDHLKTGNK